MSKTTSFTQRILASSANLSVYTAGVAVYSTPARRGAKVRPLSSVGQWVFMNADTQLSTGEDATPSTVPNLKIGVTIGKNGVPEYIRWFSDTPYNGCAARTLRGRAPNCAVGAIKDIIFGNCIECGKTYSVNVRVYNPITEALGLPDGSYIYTFSYTPPCPSCDSGDCPDTTINPDQIMCGLYNKIKGIQNDPNWDIKLNNFPPPADHEYQFDVAKLYKDNGTNSTTFEYCLTATDGTCADCNNYTAVGGFSTDETTVFDPVTYLSDNGTNVTRREHIDSVIDQINDGLGGNGNAVYLPAVGNCCSNNKLEVNTCLTNFQLRNAAGAVIEPCGDSNPFSDVTIYNECQDCANSDSTKSFSAGLRFFSKAVEAECDCVPGSLTLATYFHELEISTIGFENGDVYPITRQTATLPEGQGFTWITKELGVLENGGTEPFVYENYGGRQGLSIKKNDLLAQATVDCEQAYCSIQALIGQETGSTVTGERRFFPQTIVALIPDDHATAKTSFLSAINNYFADDCDLIATVTCEA